MAFNVHDFINCCGASIIWGFPYEIYTKESLVKLDAKSEAAYKRRHPDRPWRTHYNSNHGFYTKEDLKPVLASAVAEVSRKGHGLATATLSMLQVELFEDIFLDSGWVNVMSFGNPNHGAHEVRQYSLKLCEPNEEHGEIDDDD